MLEKLTKAQEKLMHQVREEWLSYFFSGQEIDKDKAQKGIEWLYEFSGLKKPQVIFVDSPLAVQIAVNMLQGKKRNQVENQVRNQVWNQVRNQVGGQVGGQVENQVWDQVGGQVGSQVWDQVGSQVWDQVGGQVGSQVRGQVGSQVRGQVGSQVWDQVCGQVGSQVWDQVRDQKMEFFTFAYYGSSSDFVWISFYDFFDRIGIKLTNENFYKFMELMRSGIYDMVQLDGLCIVASLPKIVRRNTQNFMHSDEFPAIEWRDGFKLHYLNGVFFPEDLWKQVVSKEMPFEDILKIEDIDQRTQAMRYGDPLKFFKHVGATEIDTYTKYTKENKAINYSLYKIPKGDIFRTDAYYMLYLCPSTDKTYMSGVPEFKTVAEAMSWKQSDDFFTVSAEEWKQMVPLIHES